MRQQSTAGDGVENASITITRTGRPPLRFVGTQLGRGTTRDHNSTRWTNAAVWRTKGGKYVGLVEHMTQWQGEHDSANATCGTAREVVEWMKRDDGCYGEASQNALEDAAKMDPDIAKCWVVEVE